jgi:hypothetical protein
MAETPMAPIVTQQFVTAAPQTVYVNRSYYRPYGYSPYPVFTHVNLDIGAAPRLRHWR